LVDAGDSSNPAVWAGFTERIMESGLSLRKSAGVHSVSDQGERVSCVVGSGHYHFDAQR
jgi:hypothetical protein